MNQKDIQSLLQEALEQEIPSSEIGLWPAVRSQLAAGKHSDFKQGVKVNRLKRPPSVTFATLAITVLLTLAFATLQGRAFAQSALLFFTRAESDTFYEEPSDMTVEESTPFLEECGSWIQPTCSIEQIRSMVDFEIKELGTLPEGMYYQGATGGPDLIGYAYRYGDRDRLGGQLSVTVEAKDRAMPWVIAKSANVEQVQIGNLPGEYYKGILFQDEHGNVTWQPNDPQLTVRWEDGGSRYTLTYYSTRYPLTKEDLVWLAGNMTLEPVAK